MHIEPYARIIDIPGTLKQRPFEDRIMDPMFAKGLADNRNKLAVVLRANVGESTEKKNQARDVMA